MIGSKEIKRLRRRVSPRTSPDIIWGCLQSNQSKKLSVSILAHFFFSILLHALLHYTSWGRLWAESRVHLAWTSPRSRTWDISLVLVGSPILLFISKVQKISKKSPRDKYAVAGWEGNVQSLAGWNDLLPGLLQRLGACSKIIQEIPIKIEQSAPHFSFSSL